MSTTKSQITLPLFPGRLWEPRNVADTEMDKFRRGINANFNLNLENYKQLWEWSVNNIADFWASVWQYTKIVHSAPYERASVKELEHNKRAYLKFGTNLLSGNQFFICEKETLFIHQFDTLTQFLPAKISLGRHNDVLLQYAVMESKPMDNIPGWFPGATLNFAENLLWCREANKVAIISTGEGRQPIKVTYAQLFDSVRLAASAMRAAGAKKGDKIAAYISNCSEAVIAMLAASSIGCMWAGTSTDFGVSAVLDRLSQVKPKILFSVNAVCYNGKFHNHLPKLRQVVEHLIKEGLEKVIVISFEENQSVDVSDIQIALSWMDFIKMANPAEELIFEQLPFDHPIYILFSSGTTGKPKCIVHRAGGVLIQQKKEHVLHGNMKSEDVFFYYTTTGWMMWNWLIAGLAVGCTIVLYEGSPFYPGPSTLWELTDQLGITIFGISAKYIQSLQDVKYKPKEHHNLGSIRTILSTASPLKPESFDFVYQSIKSDVLLGSITGGTDICSLFAGLNAALPVYRGEIQCICLGMKVEAWDGPNNPSFGKPADLVCSEPFPCMPIYFLNDHGNLKYRAAYFDNYPSVWYHGDFIWINPNTGGVVMLGRSDGTLNPGGIRFGSAEIYNVVESFPQIEDSLVVGQKIGDDERVILFLKMVNRHVLDKNLINYIKQKIRIQLSPRHVPAIVLPIKDIPYTVNGKKVEIAVKRIISGEKYIPTGTLANPECLQQFYDIPNLKVFKNNM